LRLKDSPPVRRGELVENCGQVQLRAPVDGQLPMLRRAPAHPAVTVHGYLR
jgi:hypothetical protein